MITDIYAMATTRQGVLDAAPQEPGPPSITIDEIRDVSRRLRVAQQRYDQAKADLDKAKATPAPAPITMEQRDSMRGTRALWSLYTHTKPPASRAEPNRDRLLAGGVSFQRSYVRRSRSS